MFLKIMSDDGLADKDYRKKFKMIEVTQFEFYKEQTEDRVVPVPCVSYTDLLGKEQFQIVEGNVYVMNSQGKTIESWSPNV